MPPPSRPEIPMNNVVSATRPMTQPARNANPVGRGRGECRTRTAGMIDSGDSAITSAKGMSSANSASCRCSRSEPNSSSGAFQRLGICGAGSRPAPNE